MAYCVLSDVQALNQQRTYTASSKPTSAQVVSFITDVSTEIDGYLSAVGYDVPVPSTATSATVILKELNQIGASAKAEWAAYSLGEANESTRAEKLTDLYRVKLKDIKTGAISLIDAGRGNDAIRLPNEKSPDGKFNLDASGAEIAPIFTRTMDF